MAMALISSCKLPLAFFLFSLFLHAALAEIICEELLINRCAFSVASSGKRCLLETYQLGEGEVEHQCRTSEVMVDSMAGHIESDQCVDACGVDRDSVGISSDSLLEPQFTTKLCSQKCYTSCPNIIDLYFNLAAGEGVFLPDLCEAQRNNPQRAMLELLSSGVAAGPASFESSVSASLEASAPSPSPMNRWRDQTAAWPVANPVITCASMSDAGFPSNFVADPFLYVQGDNFYLFLETKNSITLHGDIGVAKSTDKGATWELLGIALDEDWHLSFPYVFEYRGQIYMMPESSSNGDLRIYRAINFPMEWKLEKIIMKKPLVDSFVIHHGGKYWLFGSDHTGFGSRKNGQLEIWYSNNPFGPWIPHKRNPVYNTDKSVGARNGGRPFVYNGDLYRIGQDCGETYGRRVRVFKVEVLTRDEYREVEVPLDIPESKKGRNAWNGARYHHLDAQQLPSGEWIAVMDGDRVPSGDSVRRFVLGVASFTGVATVIFLMGVLVGAVNCIIPLNWCSYGQGKKGSYNNGSMRARERSGVFSSKVWRLCTRMNRGLSLLQGWARANTCLGKFILFITFAVGAVLLCNGVRYIYGGNGAEEPYPLKGQHSQFTLLAMTYDARLWNLKMYVKHYSRCSSVKEIVVVWNKGAPPNISDFDSAVPVRVRVEGRNSLNNRFKMDSLITTRAVLELDDDIMMTCDDVERGFNVWRQHPDRIVGFYPRLVAGSPLEYRAEKFARANRGYNAILTGAAFMDIKLAFERYWSADAKAGRELVDAFFNCEDVLLNYLYANASSSPRTVEYVRPAWAIDTSKFSGAAISKNTQVHYRIRSKCLAKFTEMYGGFGSRKWEFNGRKDGWDV